MDSTSLRLYISMHLFDGAEQKGVCGVGMVIKLNMNHFFNLRMVVGFVTNIEADSSGLMGASLVFSIQSSASCQIFGDSKVIVDWVN